MTEVDLKQFCDATEERAWLRVPFSSGGYTFATDGAFMIRVPLVVGVPVIERAEYPNRLVAIFAPFAGAEFAKPEIASVPDTQDTSKNIACPSCGGLGKEHECPECTCTCEGCDGAGRIKQVDKVSTMFRGRIYRLKFIRQMLALPGVEICTAAPTEPRDPLKFRFTGGEGVVMPMLQKCVRHVECEPAPVPA